MKEQELNGNFFAFTKLIPTSSKTTVLKTQEKASCKLIAKSLMLKMRHSTLSRFQNVEMKNLVRKQEINILQLVKYTKTFQSFTHTFYKTLYEEAFPIRKKAIPQMTFLAFPTLMKASTVRSMSSVV